MPESKRSRGLPWLATTAICFVVGLILAVGGIKARYGTWTAATHAWRGDAILCDRYEVVLDHPQPLQIIAFRLINVSAQPVRFLGAQSSCTCAMATGLPFECPPGASKTLEVRFKPKQTASPIRESVSLFTDHPGQQVISLTIAAAPTSPSARTSP